jgi:hypothetical protein
VFLFGSCCQSTALRHPYCALALVTLLACNLYSDVRALYGSKAPRLQLLRLHSYSQYFFTVVACYCCRDLSDLISKAECFCLNEQPNATWRNLFMGDDRLQLKSDAVSCKHPLHSSTTMSCKSVMPAPAVMPARSPIGIAAQLFDADALIVELYILRSVLLVRCRMNNCCCTLAFKRQSSCTPSTFRHRATVRHTLCMHANCSHCAL